MTFHIHSATRFQMDSYIVSNTNLAPVRAIHSKRYCPVLGFDFRDEYTSWSILMFRSHSTVLETSTFFFPRQRRRCGEGHGACARADVVYESDCKIHGRKMCAHLSACFFAQYAHAALIARRYISNDTKAYEPMLEPKKYHWAPLYVIFIQGLVCRIILAIALHFKDRGRMSKPPICRWQKLCGQGKKTAPVDKTDKVRIRLLFPGSSIWMCEFGSL